jgi:hypothetical protein
MVGMKTFYSTLTLMMFLLVGCTGQPPVDTVQVPTLAQLPSATATPLPSATAFPTWTETASATPTETGTATPTPSVTFTVTPSQTITSTPTATATETPAPAEDVQAVDSLLALAQQATVLPQEFLIVPTQVVAVSPAAVSVPGQNINCVTAPTARIGEIYADDPSLAALLGCPVGGAVDIITASQVFQNGSMLYVQGSPGSIYVLASDSRFTRFDDTYNAAADPESTGQTPPSPTLYEPVRGFGKVWRTYVDVRERLGWATTTEAGNNSALQLFERGRMLTLPQRNQVLALIDDPGGGIGSWRSFSGAG